MRKLCLVIGWLNVACAIIDIASIIKGSGTSVATVFNFVVLIINITAAVLLLDPDEDYD